MCEDPKTINHSSILAMCEMVPVFEHFADVAWKVKHESQWLW